MKEDLFLPLGSIVKLKGSNSKVMITGFAVISKITGSEVYDYTGCIYPDGFVSYDTALMFNHSQIEEVYYKGFESDESREFNKNLLESYDDIKNSMKDIFKDDKEN